MEIITQKINIKTKPEEIVNITDQVKEILENSSITEGICLIFNKGSTGSIIINEDERMLKADLKEKLEEFFPKEDVYHHPSNSHSHLRTIFLGSEEVLPIKNGELDLGSWQEIMFVENDVKSRTREILVKIIGE